MDNKYTIKLFLKDESISLCRNIWSTIKEENRLLIQRFFFFIRKVWHCHSVLSLLLTVGATGVVQGKRALWPKLNSNKTALMPRPISTGTWVFLTLAWKKVVWVQCQHLPSGLGSGTRLQATLLVNPRLLEAQWVPKHTWWTWQILITEKMCFS